MSQYYEPDPYGNKVFASLTILFLFLIGFILCMARVDAAAAKTTERFAVGITITAPRAATSAAKPTASPVTTNASKPSCPKQDATGTINLMGQSWAC